MNRLLAALLYAVSLGLGAAEGQPPLQHVAIDVFDQASVRRGAEFYVNYCQGCHSLKHIRYSRLAKDYAIDDEAMKKTFLLGERKMHETLLSAMATADAELWFGAPAPDLSLTARARGADWIYSYLRSFYLDASRPSGVNNLYVDNVAMPNVMAELQGLQKPVVVHRDGVEFIERLALERPGAMRPAEFDQALTDLMNFLVYVAEPAQLHRLPLGKYVLLFLIIFTWILYRLKKEYWKDVH
jgi:ubiquinol-cytochrome c reductase cytochrome c1 subunit